jgi:hypothetical protein
MAVFYERPSRPCLTPHFATLPLSEAFGFGGPLVATTASSARFLAGIPSGGGKFFHPWDLEWLRRPAPWAEWRASYGDPRLTLLARSPSHARALESAWNRPARVAGEPDAGALARAVFA